MKDIVTIRVSDGSLGLAMATIRTWLDEQHIQAKNFHTKLDASAGGYLLTISFYSESEAALFRQDFEQH
jgi:hypothetical protein